MELMQALNWRYATKRMNGKKIPDTDLQKILDAIRLAPTSRGLQPFRVLVIDDPAIKAAIRPIADNQPQVVESSHLFVFAVWSGLTAKQVDDFIEYAAKERGISAEKLNNMKAVLIRDQLAMNDEQFYQWASKQVYIALAFALVTAAANQIDAAAMEGFSPGELDKLLQLNKQGLKSTVLLALGYRDMENDWMMNLRKVRRNPKNYLYHLQGFSRACFDRRSFYSCDNVGALANIGISMFLSLALTATRPLGRQKEQPNLYTHFNNWSMRMLSR